jgi:hypothetical protein
MQLSQPFVCQFPERELGMAYAALGAEIEAKLGGVEPEIAGLGTIDVHAR